MGGDPAISNGKFNGAGRFFVKQISQDSKENKNNGHEQIVSKKRISDHEENENKSANIPILCSLGFFIFQGLPGDGSWRVQLFFWRWQRHFCLISSDFWMRSGRKSGGVLGMRRRIFFVRWVHSEGNQIRARLF